jgi:hypothetical protein
MAKLDFPAAAASPFLAPNGVTYTYIGTEPTGHWSGTEADGSTSLESKFVEITGDDMSGDLTLGTNKITLNATTGAATFANAVEGKIFQGKRDATDDVVFLTTDEAGTTTSRGILIERGGRIRLGGDLSNTNTATGNITLNASGSAQFAGPVNIGNYDPNNASGAGTTVRDNLVYIQRPSSESDPSSATCFATVLGTEVTSRITASGSASFASNVVANRIDSQTDVIARNYSPALTYLANTQGGTDYGFLQYAADGITLAAGIGIDGSADFSGTLSAGYTTATEDQIGARFGAKSTLTSYPAIVGRNYLDGWVFTGINAAGDITSNIKADGRAEFAGAVIASNTTYDTSVYMDFSGCVGKSNMSGGGTQQFFISASQGTAVFKGTVTANGSVLTRASGDLDVGERLEKADAALKALKVAAAAASDFAALKSAIATALADI